MDQMDPTNAMATGQRRSGSGGVVEGVGGVDLDSTAAYTFELPAELIASHPLAERDASRLLLVRRDLPDLATTSITSVQSTSSTPSPITDHTFRDLPSLLRPGDLLVRNETKVIPARLLGTLSTGGKVEMLLVENAAAAVPQPSSRPDSNPSTFPSLPSPSIQSISSTLSPGSTPSGQLWWALCKPARKLQPGVVVGLPDGFTATVLEIGETGLRLLQLPAELDHLLDQHGHIPLPPYILQRRAATEGADRATDLPEDRERYQTVYAREAGSVAAPTAGLHFTPRVLEDLERRGVGIAGIILHVGIGTFRPMETGKVSSHRMHSERGHIPPETVEAIEQTKARGGRVFAVGTTTCRTLEGVAAQNGGRLVAGPFNTDLFIRPGHQFRVIDGMITNFHLPESTLMVLVSALAGHNRILAAYRHAVRERYRFFSYGDAMLICPC